MLTPLGKALRKLRIDRDQRLFDMAEKVGVTTAFLSAVETGKKSAPADLPTKIADAYGLDAEIRAELEAAGDATRTAAKLNLEGRDERTRQMAAEFARTFNNTPSDEEAQQMLKRLLGDMK